MRSITNSAPSCSSRFPQTDERGSSSNIHRNERLRRWFGFDKTTRSRVKPHLWLVYECLIITPHETKTPSHHETKNTVRPAHLLHADVTRSLSRCIRCRST